MKARYLSLIILLAILAALLSGCATTSSLSFKQRYAIFRVERIFKTYNKHYAARDEIIEIIKSTQINLNEIVEIASFAASRGSNTPVYVEIARYASIAQYASDEFVTLAIRVKPHTTPSDWKPAAEALALAGSEEEVRELRRELF